MFRLEIQRIEPFLKPWWRGFSTCINLLSTTQLAIPRREQPMIATESATRKGADENKTKILSQEQMNQFSENGYVVVKNVLGKGEIEEIKDAIQDFTRWSSKLKKNTDVYILSDDHCEEKPMLERVICPSLHHPTFARLIRHPKVLDAVQDLIGPSFRYMPQEKLNAKPAGKGIAIPWHQDWAFFPHTNDSVVTASILIDDSSRENGCLQVFPGSHKGVLYDHFRDGAFTGAINDDEFHPDDPVFLEAPAGSVTVHHVRTIHGSAPNRSGMPRRIACFIYTAMDAWPLLGVAGPDFRNVGPVSWDLLNETLVRGEPTAFPRLKDCPVKLPLPFLQSSTVIGKFFDKHLPRM